MNDQEILTIDSNSASIQMHLSIIQSVVQRMAANSSNSKAWCITIVSAILVIIADKGKPEYAWIALLPTFVFAALDSYYLALEKGFRNSYNNFIVKLHCKSLYTKDLYFVAPYGDMIKLQIDAIKSFSIWGFYISLVVLIATTKFIAIK